GPFSSWSRRSTACTARHRRRPRPRPRRRKCCCCGKSATHCGNSQLPALQAQPRAASLAASPSPDTGQVMRCAPLLLALAVALPAFARDGGPTLIPEEALRAAAQLREQALADDPAWKVTESLTTEVGPRVGGSEADARAVEWAKARFEALGYDRVWTQPVTFPRWVRRGERAEVLGPHAQPLALTALGGSPGGTVEGEVVRFESLEALQAAPAGS